jgi:hypothetical protein
VEPGRIQQSRADRWLPEQNGGQVSERSTKENEEGCQTLSLSNGHDEDKDGHDADERSEDGWSRWLLGQTMKFLV